MGKIILKSLFILLGLSLLFSCKKFIQVGPPANSLTTNSVFSNTASAASVVTNLYMKMQSNDTRSLCTFVGTSLALSGDELVNYNGGDALLQKIYTNSLQSTLNDAPNFWSAVYNQIYSINTAIEGISASSNIPQTSKNQFVGECLFLRAFFYFYLVNIYSDAPILTTSDYKINGTASRSSEKEVYTQIEKDLLASKELLSESYLTPNNTVTNERVRPNKFTAAALLSRVYLFEGKWQLAEVQASEVIANTKYTLCKNLNDVFLMNSSEAIWQLQPSNPGLNTFDGIIYVLKGAPGGSGNPFALSSSLINEFDSKDLRLQNWIQSIDIAGTKYYYAFKYKIGGRNQPLTEYHMMFRLSEQYLIRSEARLNQGKIPLSKADLDSIRTRAGLPLSSAVTTGEILNDIVKQRQLELFTEWGHRWFDMKRLGKIDQIMQAEAVKKGTTWSHNWALYPIPSDDILKDANLSQNPGYN